MRAGWMAAVGFAIAFVATEARGDEAVRPSLGRTWALPELASLREGSFALVPQGPAPARIPATEKVEGLVVSAPEIQVQKARPLVRMSKKRLPPPPAPGRHAVTHVSAVNVSGGAGGASAEVCLEDPSDAQDVHADEDDEDATDGKDPAPAPRAPRPLQWASNGWTKLSPMFEMDKPAEAVRAVHMERFVPGGEGRAALAVTDAWVDLRTTGARAIARYTLPLDRVFVGPNGLEVYAVRDGQSVQVVVRAATGEGASTPEAAEAVRSAVGSLSVALPGGASATAECGHVRFALHASPGAGEMATLRSTAYLRPLHEVPGVDADAASAMRQRPFQLTVSASQSSTDPKPWLSVSLGWAGREQPPADVDEPRPDAESDAARD